MGLCFLETTVGCKWEILNKERGWGKMLKYKPV